MSGKYDVSVAAFYVTPERNEVVDFLPVIDVGYHGVIIPRPTGSDLTVENYIKEFHVFGWIAILLSYIFVWILLSMLLLMDCSQSRLIESLFTSFYIVLRAMIGKVISILASDVAS